AGQHHGVDVVQRLVPVPQGHGLGTGEPDGARGVPVVQRAGERDDADPGARDRRGGGLLRDRHQAFTGSATSADASVTDTTSSITGLDRRVVAASRAASRISGVTSPSTSSSNRLPCRTPENWVNPRRGSAPTTALPWGSRISGLGMTSTTTRPTKAPC